MKIITLKFNFSTLNYCIYLEEISKAIIEYRKEYVDKGRAFGDIYDKSKDFYRNVLPQDAAFIIHDVRKKDNEYICDIECLNSIEGRELFQMIKEDSNSEYCIGTRIAGTECGINEINDLRIFGISAIKESEKA